MSAFSWSESKHVDHPDFYLDVRILSPKSTCTFLETWEDLEIRNIFWHIKGCGCEQGSSKAQVCGLTLLFSCCKALKVILVCFERQLGSQWYWLSLQVKEMALRKVGGLALWDFLDFIVRTRIPIFVLLRPFIQCKVWCVLFLEMTSPRNALFSQLRQDCCSRARGTRDS